MTGRTWDGLPLTPGVNVDKVNIAAGVAAAHRIGYGAKDWREDMVITYALQRHARGEESGAERTFFSHFGKSHFTGWRMILAAAVSHG